MPNILVVDDEKSITDLIEVYLKNENFQVYKFYNGKDALSCLKNTRIDLAVLDIMPSGHGWLCHLPENPGSLHLSHSHAYRQRQ